MNRIVASTVVALLLSGVAPVGASAATVLSFDVQPGGGAAGSAWAQQPVVAVRTNGTIDPTMTGSISLAVSPGTGAAGASLTCDDGRVRLDHGVAAFSGCRIDLAATGYRLTATWTHGGTADSASFTITPSSGGGGMATKLGFLTQPARGTPATALAVQPTVALQNAAGATQAADPPTTVTVALGANPGGAVLSCSGGLSKATTNGVAAFSGCRVDKVGVGYTILATASGLTSATSALFDVADRLAFTTQPAGATGGVAFTTQPVVAVRAGASATATHDGSTIVTLAIKPGTGAAGAALSCTGGLSRAVVGGVATFAGCAIDRASPAANPYVLIASATGLASAESVAMAVTVGTAAKLVFTAQPASGIVGQAFPVQPIVAITDAGGNTVTTGASSTKTVALSVGVNPASGTLNCTGGLSRPAVAGVATFAGCALNAAGVGYTLVASSAGLPAATSKPFNVVGGATLTISNSASVITWASQISIAARFDQSGANRVVQFQRSRDGFTWTTFASLVTSSSGTASVLYAPATNLYYRAVFAGAADLGALTSNTTRTVVRQYSVLRSINRGFVVRLGAGTSVLFTDTVRPARPELSPATVRFVFYRRGADGIWRLYAQRDVTINSLGKAATTWNFPVPGEWYVRSQARPTPSNANSVWGPIQRFSAR